MDVDPEDLSPEDLKVETEEDYHRFARLAEQQELNWMADYTLTRVALCIEVGLSAWELEFVIALGQKMKDEHETGNRVGLTVAQRSRLDNILERLES